MIGQYVQNYKIVSHLGEGGMGVVYKAVDNVLGREVALKMLHTSMIRQPQVLERFKKEAQVLARLLHPNIAVIYNFIEQDGQYFMVMEYVEGKNLDVLAKTQQVLPHTVVVAIFMQALEGLQHAHKKGIFHRDIKPSNLILTPEGTVKLMDFGIAKIAGEQRLTQVNRVIGTVEFMAPELIEGKEPSIASDIYATGITMYELLSGRLPFESNSDYNLMQEILKKKPAHLKTINPAVPPALANIVMQALEKKPENRFAGAKDFQQALLASFPACRETDLSVLSPSAQPIYATREESVTHLSDEKMTALSMQTRLENTAPATTVQQFEQKFLLNRKLPYILAGIGLIIFLAFFFPLLMKKDPGENIHPKDITVKTDTVKSSSSNQFAGNQPVLTDQVVQQDPVHINNPPPEKITAVEDKPVKKKTEKKAEKKETEKKEKKEAVPVPVAEEKKPDPPVVKKAERKEIVIRDKIELNVSMRETITNAADDRDQSVSFTVTSPVVYEGITIIRQGAVARGNIKIGRVLSTVDITSVMAANGQEIALRQRDHRKVKSLASERDYRAFLLKGTRMSFY